MKKLCFVIALALCMGVFTTASAQGWDDVTQADVTEWRKEAERGDAWAQSSLGWAYNNGEGIYQDYGEAAKWFRKAAEQGSEYAQYNLGYAYDNGQGVDQDYGEAMKWFRKAAEQGNEYAQSRLGWAYDNGQGVDQDYGEAVKWYRRATEQGNVYAQYNLGVAYDNGKGVDQDYGEAVKWYRKAAEQGYADAQSYLGYAYHYGEGINQDYGEAVKWYRKAAEQGHMYAQNNLGAMYWNGNGVINDDSESYIWYSIAKANGHEDAAKALRENNWSDYLTRSEIKAAKRKAARRMAAIERRAGETETKEPTIGLNIAQLVFDTAWRSIAYIESGDVQGSGVIVGVDSVATNCHVIEGGKANVFPPNSREETAKKGFHATVLRRDTERDFCLLRVSNVGGQAASIREFDTLQIGEAVYALGAPEGLELTLTSGIISQLRRNDGKRLIQTNAAISPGSSGGGLFDADGNLIGITTSGISGDNAQGLNFAIPADLVLEQ